MADPQEHIKAANEQPILPELPNLLEQLDLPDEQNASLVTVPFLQELLRQFRGELVEMLDERARARSPPVSPTATIPRPPSEPEPSRAATEENVGDGQYMPEQEMDLPAEQQLPRSTESQAYAGQPIAPSYPTWLTPPQQLANNLSSLKPAAKARLPDPFEPGKIDLRQWIFQMDNYFAMTRTSDQERVPYAAQLFKGSAMSWWIGLLGQLAAPGSTVPPITGWDDVKSRLYAQFASVNPHKEARVKLDALRQTHSVQDYINKFNKLAMDIPMMTQEEMIYRFEQGLKPSVQAEMAKTEFSTLTALFAAAQKFDAISWRGKESTGASNSAGRGNYGSNRNDKGKAPAIHQLSALDLQAIQNLLQGSKQPRTDHKKKKPQDQRAKQPTLVQAEPTQFCTVVQRPGKLTPEEKERLAKTMAVFDAGNLATIPTTAQTSLHHPREMANAGSSHLPCLRHDCGCYLQRHSCNSPLPEA